MYCALKNIKYECYLIKLMALDVKLWLVPARRLPFDGRTMGIYHLTYSTKETLDKPWNRSFLLNVFTRLAKRNSHVYSQG